MADKPKDPFDLKYMQFLSKEKPEIYLKILTERTNEIKAWIHKKDASQREQELFLNIVTKAASLNSDRDHVIVLVSLLVSSHYINRLHELLDSTTKDNDLDSNLHIIRNSVKLLVSCDSRVPNSMLESLGFLQIIKDKIHDYLEILSTRGEDEKQQDFISLLEDVDNLKQSILKRFNQKANKQPEPPDDFRQICVFPLVEDIFNTGKPFLRKVLSKGAFDDLNHYLDVQFRLLREDYISPLREGILEYITKSQGEEVDLTTLQDVRLYKGVTSCEKEVSFDGLIYTMGMNREHIRNIDWESSKRFMHGSLLCLTPDKFKTVYFATVHDRNKIQETQSIKIKIAAENDSTTLPINVTFTMLESTTFFKPYCHVLECLQNTYPGDLPFERYIVQCCDQVMEPLYLRENASTLYDMHPIISKAKIDLGGCRPPNRNRSFTKTIDERNNVDVLSGTWPKAEELHMDQAQYDAFKAALTEEIVIIQGPPGTGKTYLGLQIAKTLLHNRQHWLPSFREDTLAIQGEINTQPMLIVCCTNHALDQFLEGIIEFSGIESNFTNSGALIRVGGQCTNHIVKNFELKTERKRFRSINNTMGYSDYIHQVEANHKRIAKLKFMIKKSRRVVLDQNILSTNLPHLRATIKHLNDENFTMVQWLGIDTKRWISIARTVGKSSTDKTSAEEYSFEYEEDCLDGNIKLNNTELINVETDELNAIYNRRIEEDEMETDYTFDVNIGTDIDDLLIDLLKDSKLSKEIKAFLRDKVKGVKKKLSSTVPMTQQDAKRIGNAIWNMHMNDRWRLYSLLSNQYREKLSNDIKELENEFPLLHENYKKETQKVDTMILKRATVVGMTTTGAASYQSILREIGPKIVIVEEAAEVLEAHIIASLSPKCEHLILIGDHKQLEPKPAVYELAKKFNLSLSMFERMINNNVKYHCLETQHRMRPEISQLVRHIYPRLKDNDNVFSYQNIKGISKNIFFVTHDKLENFGSDGKSYSNHHEAQFLVGLCRYLLQQGYDPQQITVLTPYSGQKFYIRNLMPKSEFDGIRICILDNYQGEENDIILLSLVRSNTNMKIGFLNKENRVCVGLSRAKLGLFVIGNFHLLTTHSTGGKLWTSIIQNLGPDCFGNALPLRCQNHTDREHVIESHDDFSQVPDGGCSQKCDFRLACGHVCGLYCHSYDREHKRYKCGKQCFKRCKMNHQCQQLCHYPDNCQCKVKVVKRLPLCDHSAIMECYFPPEDYKCKINVERELTCGHVIVLACHIDITTYQCSVIVKKTLPLCGHQADMKCRTSPSEFQSQNGCQERVTRTLPNCGHLANTLCFKNPYTVKCTTIIQKDFDCTHPPIKIQCHKSSAACCPVICEKRCERNHTCKKMCHHPLPCHCQILVNKTLPKCGHQMEMPCSNDPDDQSLKCTELVIKTRLCGHEMELKCWVSVQSVCSRKLFLKQYENKCEEIITQTLPLCGHTASIMCFENPHNVKCKQIIEKKFKCHHSAFEIECHRSMKVQCVEICDRMCERGHTCKKPCHHPLECNCQVLVIKTLPDCGHHKEIACSTDPQYAKCVCTEPVTKILLCGHDMVLECSESINSVLCSANLITENLKSEKLESNKLGLKMMLSRYENQSKKKCTEMDLKTFPLCGHQEFLMCFESPLTVQCKTIIEIEFDCCHPSIEIECHKSSKVKCTTVCGKLCERGHTCQKTCHHPEDCHCKVLVNKTLLKCGHDKEMPCSIDSNNDTVKCSQLVNKTLPCGHDMELKCSSSVKSVLCSENLQKYELFLSKHPKLRLKKVRRCNEKIIKGLVCGHRLEVECGRSTKGIHCLENVIVHLSKCGHPKEVKCSAQGHTNEFVCREMVDTTLPCGHHIIKECNQTLKDIKCSVIVKKECSYCHHVTDTECQNVLKCTNLIRKTSPVCGHENVMECFKDPKEFPCPAIVKRECSNCHQETDTECQNVLKYVPCTKPVRKKNPVCGHENVMECFKDPKEFPCPVIVKRECTNCHQETDTECQNVLKYVPCRKPVRKKNPVCGHENVIQCFKDPIAVPCSELINIQHPICRHFVNIPCSEKAFVNPCTEQVTITLFCGEEIQIDCWRSKTAQYSVRTKCHKSLQCGHECSHKCVDCKSGMLHVNCKMSCGKPLFCGHLCTSNTCGSCGLCGQLCFFQCVHRKCKHSCSEMCLPCRKPCTWSCPHFKCTSLCYEFCNRPRCNKRCQKSIKCGHKCMGFCGEPCPSLCGICQSDILKVMTSKHERDIIIVELPDCKHIFESEELDHYMDKVTTDCINIKRCPKCQVIITLHPRYNNVLKQQFQTINSIRIETTSMAKQKKWYRFPLFSKSILNCKSYFERCKSYLKYNEKFLIKFVGIYRYARDLLDDSVAFIDKLLVSKDSTLQNYIDIYRAEQKLCALWLLFIVLVHNREDHGYQISAPKGLETFHKNIVEEVENVIKSIGIFNENDIDKVEKICIGAVQNQDLYEKWTSVAHSYPRLPTAVDVHQASWKFCEQGHLMCSLCNDLTNCWRCHNDTARHRQSNVGNSSIRDTYSEINRAQRANSKTSFRPRRREDKSRSSNAMQWRKTASSSDEAFGGTKQRRTDVSQQYKENCRQFKRCDIMTKSGYHNRKFRPNWVDECPESIIDESCTQGIRSNSAGSASCQRKTEKIIKKQSKISSQRTVKITESYELDEAPRKNSDRQNPKTSNDKVNKLSDKTEEQIVDPEEKYKMQGARPKQRGHPRYHDDSGGCNENRSEKKQCHGTGETENRQKYL